MLKTEQNTKTMEGKIKQAAKQAFPKHQYKRESIFPVFEHGQWWIKFYDLIEDKERIFSVQDASGVGSINGFCFEEV